MTKSDKSIDFKYLQMKVNSFKNQKSNFLFFLYCVGQVDLKKYYVKGAKKKPKRFFL